MLYRFLVASFFVITPASLSYGEDTLSDAFDLPAFDETPPTTDAPILAEEPPEEEAPEEEVVNVEQTSPESSSTLDSLKRNLQLFLSGADPKEAEEDSQAASTENNPNAPLDLLAPPKADNIITDATPEVTEAEDAIIPDDTESFSENLSQDFSVDEVVDVAADEIITETETETEAEAVIETTAQEKTDSPEVKDILEEDSDEPEAFGEESLDTEFSAFPETTETETTVEIPVETTPEDSDADFNTDDSFAESLEDLSETDISDAAFADDIDVIESTPAAKETPVVTPVVSAPNASESKPSLEKAPTAPVTPIKQSTPAPAPPKATKETPLKEITQPTVQEEAAPMVATTAKAIPIPVPKPANVDHLLVKGYKALVADQAIAAVNFYKEALIDDPKNSDALFGAAAAYQRAHQYPKSLEYYTKLLIQKPNHSDSAHNLLLIADQLPQADVYESLISIETAVGQSRFPEALVTKMAGLALENNQFAKALPYLKKAVNTNPNTIAYHYNLAIAYDQLGKTKDAIAHYQIVLAAAANGQILPGPIAPLELRLNYLKSLK